MPLPGLTFDEAYYNGASTGYTRYSPEMWAGTFTFEGFARGVTSRHGAAGAKVLVCGCALGYSVQALRDQGVDAWGIDLSAYAVSNAPAAVAPYLVQGDATTDLDRARTAAGLKGRTTFELVIDEDLLTCLTDTEAATACGEMRRVGAKVAHRLSVHPLADYNTKPLADWRALVDPTGRDAWYVYTTWEAR